MIGLLLNRKDTTYAIDQSGCRVNPSVAELDSNTYWLAETPSIEQIGSVASWGVLGQVFDITNKLSISEAERKVKYLEQCIPAAWYKNSHGKVLKKSLLDMMNISDRLMAPFPRDVETKLLDQVRIAEAGIESKFIAPMKSVRLRHLTLPENITHTKRISSPRAGHEGIFNISILEDHKTFKLGGQDLWVTTKQMEVLEKKRVKIEIHEAIKFLKQDEFVRADRHPMLENILTPIIKNKTKKEDREVLEKIIIDFLMSIPRTQGTHPASILIRGQAWSINAIEALKMLGDGLNVTSFNCKGVWVNLNG